MKWSETLAQKIFCVFLATTLGVCWSRKKCKRSHLAKLFIFILLIMKLKTERSGERNWFHGSSWRSQKLGQKWFQLLLMREFQSLSDETRWHAMSHAYGLIGSFSNTAKSTPLVSDPSQIPLTLLINIFSLVIFPLHENH